MKSPPSLKVVTPALAVVVGGALFILLGREQENPNLPSTRVEEELITTTKSGVRITSTSRGAIAQLISEQREADQKSESRSSLSLRDFSLETIEEQKKARETEREEHHRLLALAKKYEPIEDLSTVLLEALVTDDEDACRAIFLEWYRRDPGAAFDAVAIRENWRTWYLGASDEDSAVFRGIPTSELIAQATDQNRPKDFRGTMFYCLAHRLSSNDDLKSLTETLQQFERQDHQRLIDQFLYAWVPDDGAAAAAFIANEMPRNEQFHFLNSLTGGPYGLPNDAWTEDFSTALLQQELDISEELRGKLEEEARRSALPMEEARQLDQFPFATQFFNNDDSQTKPEPPPPPPPGLDHHLYFEKDYPQLFAEGEISPDEIADAMARSVGHPLSDQELREVFAHLAPHHPNQAIEWARTRLPPSSLPADTASTLAYLSGMIRAHDSNTIPSLLQSGHLDDPRASRLVQWLEAFQPHLQAGADDTFDHNLRILQGELQEWTSLAPEAADKATSVLPSDHAVWTVPDRN